LREVDPFNLISFEYVSDNPGVSTTYSVSWTRPSYYITGTLVDETNAEKSANPGTFTLTITKDTSLEIFGTLNSSTPMEMIPWLSIPLTIHLYNRAGDATGYVTGFNNSYVKINGVTHAAGTYNARSNPTGMQSQMTLELPNAPSIMIFDEKIPSGNTYASGTLGNEQFSYKYRFDSPELPAWLVLGGATQMNYSGSTIFNVKMDTSKTEMWIFYYR
jgi:hypothetical protein